jgi:2-(1,2-epoxy-1,2-dihydrophenyl)acetyl-CoA isomerase
MSNEEEYLFEIREGVGIITINRPKRLNAMTWDLATALIELLRGLRKRDEVRTLVLTGAGRGFCSGADAAFFSGSERALPGLSDDPTAMPRYQRKTPAGPFTELTRTIVEVEKPVIAALHGPVMGAGLGYALACDRRFGDSTTKMCAAMIKLGFAPDCGISYFLPRVTTLPMALRMVETADVIEAEEAHRFGLIDELVDEGGDFEAALRYATELAQGPSVAVDLCRRGIHKGQTSNLDEMNDYEQVACTMAASTYDAREGTEAFEQKRKPKFRGY